MTNYQIYFLCVVSLTREMHTCPWLVCGGRDNLAVMAPATSTRSARLQLVQTDHIPTSTTTTRQDKFYF
jgi:hypothetical protein